jgi:transporter family-2 protein
MFHVTPAPSARAATAARVSVLRTAETVRLVKSGYLLLALAGGAMLPVQAGINAQLARWIDSPVRAALVSFAVGTAALLLLTLAAYRAWPEDGVGAAPWWVWTGGLLGAFYVFASIAAAPKLGAATLIGAILAGQAVAALVVDNFGWVGFDESPITVAKVLGLALIAAGLVVIRFA